MPPSKFEANPTLHRGVKRASFSLFTLASSCANAYFRAYAIIDVLADRLVFLNTVTYVPLVKQNVMKFEVFILGGQRIVQKRKKGWWRGSRRESRKGTERG